MAEGATGCQPPSDGGMVRFCSQGTDMLALRPAWGSGVPGLASVRTRPAPPMARLPRWTKCQSLAKSSREVYSHMGETAMRLGRVRLRSLSGAKRWAVGWGTEG